MPSSVCTCTYVRLRHGVPTTCVLIPVMRTAVAPRCFVGSVTLFEISSHVRNADVTVRRGGGECQWVERITVSTPLSTRLSKSLSVRSGRMPERSLTGLSTRHAEMGSSTHNLHRRDYESQVRGT